MPEQNRIAATFFLPQHHFQRSSAVITDKVMF